MTSDGRRPPVVELRAARHPLLLAQQGEQFRLGEPTAGSPQRSEHIVGQAGSITFEVVLVSSEHLLQQVVDATGGRKGAAMRNSAQ